MGQRAHVTPTGWRSLKLSNASFLTWPTGRQSSLIPMFCSVRYHLRVKFSYRCTPRGCKEAGKDRVNKAGETSNEHSHPKIRSLKQVL